MNAATAGACKSSVAAPCGGFAGLQCPADGAVCAYLFETKTECSVSDPTGTCWVMPSFCPPIVIGGSWRSCAGGNFCAGHCTAIKSGNPYWFDNSCPL
jgi:hypothetical protein